MRIDGSTVPKREKKKNYTVRRHNRPRGSPRQCCSKLQRPEHGRKACSDHDSRCLPVTPQCLNCFNVHAGQGMAEHSIATTRHCWMSTVLVGAMSALPYPTLDNDCRILPQACTALPYRARPGPYGPALPCPALVNFDAAVVSLSVTAGMNMNYSGYSAIIAVPHDKQQQGVLPLVHSSSVQC